MFNNHTDPEYKHMYVYDNVTVGDEYSVYTNCDAKKQIISKEKQYYSAFRYFTTYKRAKIVCTAIVYNTVCLMIVPVVLYILLKIQLKSSTLLTTDDEYAYYMIKNKNYIWFGVDNT